VRPSHRAGILGVLSFYRQEVALASISQIDIGVFAKNSKGLVILTVYRSDVATILSE
jgi:hypothetical protein